MSKFLPFIFLISFFCLFGLSWIVVQVDPDTAPWYFFALFVILLFVSICGFLGIIIYFVRTKFHKRYDPALYFKNSFKMSLFVASFIAIATTLSLLQLVTTLNIALAIMALVLFAVWSYLGKKKP